MRIAVMQPYFVPYQGYFRLFDVDVFVLYDDVQFPRRGFVHRNKLKDRNGVMQWMTLPLRYAPQDVLISELRFANDEAIVRFRMQEYARRFGALNRLPTDVQEALFGTGGLFQYYAVRLLVRCARHLGVKVPRLIYSSEFNLPAELRGRDRIIAICKELKAETYLNAPGGRSMYQPEDFSAHGISLEFLPDWDGPMESVLEVLAA